RESRSSIGRRPEPPSGSTPRASRRPIPSHFPRAKGFASPCARHPVHACDCGWKEARARSGSYRTHSRRSRHGVSAFGTDTSAIRLPPAADRYVAWLPALPACEPIVEAILGADTARAVWPLVLDTLDRLHPVVV